ncbi:hypothetical protein M3599_04480 [Niallia circulans]|uniref:hypothetical protein n=1 Tax=Niallia circulans TaxID=1397 RepID=UPI00203FC3DA|nr:hypothetical protein [Niallia circulans]MCM2980183.1 hypothetical protein [Niallia circulans]
MVSFGTFIIGVAVAIITFFVLDNFTSPLFLNIFICYVLVFVTMLITTWYRIHATRNIEKLEKLFSKNNKHPYYSFVHALSVKEDKRVIVSYRKLMKRKKYQAHYPIFTILFSLYFGKTLGLREEAEKIKHSEMKSYYLALINIEEQQFPDAQQWITRVNKKWMKEALLAEIAIKKEEKDVAKKHAKSALKHTKGIQYYVLKKTYEREFHL